MKNAAGLSAIVARETMDAIVANLKLSDKLAVTTFSNPCHHTYQPAEHQVSSHSYRIGRSPSRKIA
jgi:hypothetical protein